MIWFVVSGAVLVIIALSWLLPSLLRREPAANGMASAASNLAILSDELAELERDVASGTLSQQQVQQAREDLQRRVLEDGREPEGARKVQSPAGGKATAVVLAIAIPLCAALLYWNLGSPGAISVSPRGGAHATTAAEVDAMVAGLAARLEREPENANGWVMLARSYAVMRRYDDAARAYSRAAALIKDDAGLLADYADVLGMVAGGRIEGKSLQLVEQALKIDASHWKALALAGSAAFARKDYRNAVAYWEKLHGLPDLNPEIASTVAANLEEARQLGGLKVKGGDASRAKPASSGGSAAATTAGASVRGSVSLASTLAGKADPSDTVFIFARAADGPRIPLAILRRQVRDLPVTFTLDDSLAMSPQMKLSNFAEVVVGARISKSGSATPQSGDLQGLSQKLKPGGAPVKVLIDQAVP